MKAPGARGSYGEFLLEQLLAESLPSEHFTTQYTFNDGQRVDAIVRLPDGILPVDSKFPLDAFRRYVSTSSEHVSRREWQAFLTAVRKHIDDVQKYIRPQEGTLPVALMYVPSESVYYEIVVRNGGLACETNTITAYARDRSVFIVSPNTLYCYLQAIAVGLRGLRIGQRAKEVLNDIEGLRREFANVQECLSVLGSHLNKAKNKQEELARLTDRCQDRLSLASSLESSAPRSELNP